MFLRAVFFPSRFTEVKISEGKTVLVAKHGDNVFAIGDKCPHAGAPLIKGAVSNGKVRCPWHAACFDLKTGKSMACQKILFRND